MYKYSVQVHLQGFSLQKANTFQPNRNLFAQIRDVYAKLSLILKEKKRSSDSLKI